MLFLIKDLRIQQNLNKLIPPNKKGIFIGKDRICSACKYAKEKEKIDWKKREEKITKAAR